VHERRQLVAGVEVVEAQRRRQRSLDDRTEPAKLNLPSQETRDMAIHSGLLAYSQESDGPHQRIGLDGRRAQVS
jgi:hypothetical protein